MEGGVHIERRGASKSESPDYKNTVPYFFSPHPQAVYHFTKTSQWKGNTYGTGCGCRVVMRTFCRLKAPGLR